MAVNNQNQHEQAIEAGGSPLVALAAPANHRDDGAGSGGRRWVIERTHAWGNLYGRRR